MVNIDTVYQKVLALCNKEQRGYVTPQEFNLLSDKAQVDIYESYFHDLKTAHHKPSKNQIGHADEIEMIEEKLQPFYNSIAITTTNDTVSLPTEVYRLINITRGSNEVTQLNRKEVTYTENNPLTAATLNRSIFIREQSNNIQIIPTAITTIDDDGNTVGEAININYYKRPTNPHWAYIIVSEKALYNSNQTTHFQLHPSEEENLVTRILQLAGIIIMKPGIVEIAAQDNANTKAQQNN